MQDLARRSDAFVNVRKKQEDSEDSSDVTETKIWLGGGTEESGSKVESVSSDAVYRREGDRIYFGSYPQSLKADDVKITANQDSHGYYLGSDGCYYAAVKAFPNESRYRFSTGEAITRGAIYYFKVEPIKWRVLSESSGIAFIVCDGIIANHIFAKNNINNYAESEIRRWLNNEFYNTAFDPLQQGLIETTNVDNSFVSTIPDRSTEKWKIRKNRYACENTFDKVFLLSMQEATSAQYGFAATGVSDSAKHRQTSDYSRATGAWMMIINNACNGQGWWWLRSPAHDLEFNVPGICYDGSAYDRYSVRNTNFGVVPALRIKL